MNSDVLKPFIFHKLKGSSTQSYINLTIGINILDLFY
jgi:hypothetical protein